jgi:hypothetical protein
VGDEPLGLTDIEVFQLEASGANARLYASTDIRVAELWPTLSASGPELLLAYSRYLPSARAEQIAYRFIDLGDGGAGSGVMDAGVTDAGSKADAGVADGGADAGAQSDSGVPDGGRPTTGGGAPLDLRVGCGCGQAQLPWLALALLALRVRRRHQ